MSAQTTREQFRFIPIGKLSLSSLNVRTTNADTGIHELAALIRAQGVLQNLTVHGDEKENRKRGTAFAVVAGGRRWRALQLLIKEKHITSAHEVPCMVVSYDRAVEISLAENSGRESMHPADQFEAFRKLIDAGQSVEDVAARFGVTSLIVQRRLKLANVCPEFLALYREGKLTLEHLMAFAVTDDPARQKEAWASLKPYERHPGSLRRALTINEVSTRDPIARFVGIKVYEKAGGLLRRDLFADEEDAFILDPELLKRLAADKLSKHAARVKNDGNAWVDVTPHLDYADLAAYERVRTVLREPTPEEQSAIDDLTARQTEIEKQLADAGEDDERLAELSEREDEIEDEIEQLREQRTIPDPEQAALTGAIVSIGTDGKVRIDQGLLRADDAKRLAAARQPDSDGEDDSTKARTHSAALTRRLTAHKTAALQATLAQKPEIALIALAHRLVLRMFYVGGGPARASGVQIDATRPQLEQYVPDIRQSKAYAALEAQREVLKGTLPQDPAELLTWLTRQTQAHVLSLLAYCVALTLDGVQSDESSGPCDALSAVSGLDMRGWWTATADNYFKSVPKAKILAAVTEVLSPDATAPLDKLNKSALAKAAEDCLASSGWLPEILRAA